MPAALAKGRGASVMTHSLRRCAAACAILALVSLAAGHIRLIYSGNGNLLFLSLIHI